MESADGTVIAYDRCGRGPVLVLVVGAFCDRTAFGSLADVLAAEFTVFTYDRRGRGGSGERAEYAVDREIDDLEAVISAAGGSACVFGHSSGAALALLAAARGSPISRLVAYEPPWSADDTGSDGLRDELARLVAAGRRGDAAKHFLAQTGMPAEVLEAITAAPSWPAMEAMAPTLLHELDVVGNSGLPTERLAAITVPTLVLGGWSSPGWLQETGRVVAATVPAAWFELLPGQDHNPADDVLAPVLIEFLTR